MSRHAIAVGVYCIDAIPNQPQVAHCHSFFIHEQHRGKGYAIELKRHQMNTLRELGFNFATCTTAGNNERQHRVLEAAGWKRLAEFRNTRDGAATVMWGWEVKPAVQLVEAPDWEAA